MQMKELKFSDIVDLTVVQAFMESQWQTSGIMLTVTDPDQKVLADAGWQEICTQFHRRHPETLHYCQQSDSTVNDHLERLKTEGGYHEYRCKNGLMSIAMPVFIDGVHLATLLTGQFLYHPADRDQFRQQARRYGFDEHAYLAALDKVPVLSQKQVETTRAFMRRFVDLIGHMAHEKLAQLKTQHQLQQSEQKFRTLFKHSNDAIYICRLDGRLIEVNQAACALLGYAREHLLQRSIPNILAPERAIHFEQRVAEIVGLGNQLFETTLLHADGHRIPVEVNIRSFDYQGQPALLSSARDISERKQVEQALCVSERRYATLLDNLPGMVYHCHNDRQWTMEFISDGCLELTGYHPKELLHNSHLSYNDIIHPQDRDRLWQHIQDAVNNRQPFTMEYRLQTKQGQERWVWEQGRGVFNDNGDLLALEGFITDISERKRVENNLRESEQHYRAVVEGQTELICRFYPDGRLNFVNEAYCRYFGKTKQELLGQLFTPMIPEEDIELCHRNIRALSAEQPTGVNIHRVIRHDNSLRWLRWMNRAILSDDKTIVEYQSVGQDITEQKQAEKTLAYREKFESLIANISSRFVALSVADTDSGLNAALRELGQFVNADRSYLFRFSTHLTSLSNSHEWCNHGVAPQIHQLQGLKTQSFPWFFNRINQREVIAINQVESLPPEAAAEKRHWQQQGIQSLAAVPILSRGELTGFLGFDAVHRTICWGDKDLMLLKTAAEILGNAIERQQVEQERERLLLDMGERIKELRCLYSTNQLLRSDAPLDTLLTHFLALIPPGWQFPELTRARLRLDGRIYVSQPFDVSPWQQSAQIVVNGVVRGELEVFYTEQCPSADEGVFLQEERQLINALASALGETIERKKAEKKLQAARQRLENIIEFLPDATFVIDHNKRVVAWNRAMEIMTGTPKEQVLGQGNYIYAVPFYGKQRPLLIDLLDGSDPAIEDLYLFVKQKGDSLIAETYSDAAYGGKGAYFMGVASPLFDLQGHVVGAIESIRDISDLKQAERSAQAAQKEAESARDKIEAILKSVADGLVVTDLDGRVVLMNRCAQELTGTQFSEAFSLSYQRVFQQPALIAQIDAALGGEPHSEAVEWQLPPMPPHLTRTIQARTSAVQSADGRKNGVITLLRDVSRERELDRMKNEFISTAAHELRTPLTSVIGFTEILLDAEAYEVNDPANQQELLATIYDKSKRLESIISDLLDLSRIQSGHLIRLQKNRCDFTALLRKVASHYQHEQSRQQIEITLPQSPIILEADLGKLEQVLDNLLSNAVKFSADGGHIHLSCQQQDRQICVTVTDNGIGMTAQQVERVFDKFYRGDSSDTAKPGLGLGMAIVKSIIEAHCGQIRVDSELGRGTTVTFTLPLQDAAD